MPVIDPSLIPQAQPWPTVPFSNVQQQKGQADVAGKGIENEKNAATLPYDIRKAKADAINAENQATKSTREIQNVFSPDEVKFYAEQIWSGQPVGQVVPGWGGMAGNVRQQVMKEVADYGRSIGLSGGDLAEQQAHYTNAKSSLSRLENMRAVAQQSEETALNNLQLFMDESNKAPGQTHAPLVNRALQAVGLQTGNPDVAGMNTAHQVALSEVAKVVQNSAMGGGVLSDSARKEYLDVIASNAAPEQKLAAFNVLKRDMDNRISALDNVISTGYKNMGKLPDTIKSAGIGLSPEYAKDATSASSATGTQSKPDPELEAYINHLVNTGVPYNEAQKQISDFELGRGQTATPIDQGQYEKALQYVQQPNHPLYTGADAIVKTPETGYQKTVNPLVNNFAGVGAVNALNAATVGAPELVAGQGARDALHAANEAHPVAAFVGDALGSVAPITGVEGMAGRLADKVGVDLGKTAGRRIGTEIGANAGYEGIRGFNDANTGEGGEGAIRGLATGAAGAVIGKLAGAGVRPFLSDETNAALNRMGDTDLTTLQQVGAGPFEQTFKGLPGSRGAQAKAMASWNIENGNKLLSNIHPDLVTSAEAAGTPIATKVPEGVSAGAPLNDFLATQLNNGYSVIKPQIAGVMPKDFNDRLSLLASGLSPEHSKAINEATALLNNGGMEPASGFDLGQLNAVRANYKQLTGESLSNSQAAALLKTAKATTSEFNPTYSGDTYQAAIERLRGLQNDFGNQVENGVPGARDAMVAAQNARKAIDNLIATNQPELAPQLSGLQKGWAMKLRLDDASNRAMAQNGGVYAPSQYLSAIKKFDTSSNNNAFAAGNAFGQGDALAAQHVLGSQPIPQHASLFTTGLELGALGAGAHYIPGLTEPIAAGALAAYAPGVKRITQAILNRNPNFVLGPKATAALQALSSDAMSGQLFAQPQLVNGGQ